MNRPAVIFLGAFVALAFSWAVIVLLNQVGYGRQTEHYDAETQRIYPGTMAGVAAQGELVYRDLGCIACHTQQVRRPGYGTDTAREWGRTSVARDYIRESRPLLGTQRIGPDLRNVGTRYTGESGREWHIRHLYDPQLTSPGSVMPAYRFLFETRKIVGEKSSRAIDALLPAAHQPPAGHEIVLTHRGEALVAYLLNRHDGFENYPEMQNFATETEPEAATEGGHE